ncbi:MAG: xanthine dehydrogenase, partial [bacterium]|nr:xanthine dehydrogenase [bacterium]
MRVLMPESLAEACELLAANSDVVPVAGGTDLFVHWPQRLDERATSYLDLSGLAAELKPIRRTGDELVLGALTTYWDVIRDRRVGEEFPLLVEAARQVGAIQIRTRGTWAGNIVNASPAADGVPVLMAYDAVVELVAQSGCEQIPLAEFYLGYKQMRRRPEQLIRAIRLPRRDYEVELFEKIGARRAQAITKVGVAVTRSAAGWRVVASSVAPTVCRCPALEQLLEQAVAVSSPEDLLPAIRRDVSPIDDIRSTAAYRERVLGRVLYHALREV